ncbi:MAG: hypothetical protein KDN22_18850 [Verrucomicrobiae bacterium]|nr:hypothetical protein [Verrucomicrobiae bacterium]
MNAHPREARAHAFTRLATSTAAALTLSATADAGQWKSHPIMDRAMVAGTIDAPSNWRFQGGVQWLDPNQINPADALKVAYTGTSPDGTGRFQVNPAWVWLSGQDTYDLHAFSQHIKTPLGAPHDAISIVVQQFLPSARPNARVVSSAILEQTSRTQTQFYQQFLAQSLRSGELGGVNVEVAVITIDYEENGQQYREALVSTLNHMILGSERSEQTQMRRSVGMDVFIAHRFSSEIIGMRAPANDFEAAKPQFARMLASRKNNPEWDSKVHNYYVNLGIRQARESAQQLKQAAQLHQSRMSSLKAVFDASQARYRDSNTSSDRNQRNFVNMINETETYVDPHTGNERNLDNNGEHMWIDSSGNTLPTDDASYDPRLDPDYWDRDFRPADRLR